MGKNDDFAARLARIKEQLNAPDPTRGTPTDPRSARAPAQPAPDLQDTGGTRWGARMVLGGLSAIALAVYVFTPHSAKETAVIQAAHEPRTTGSLFNAAPNSPLVFANEETDRRVALLANRDFTGFEMPENMRPFLNEEGTTNTLRQDLAMQMESN